MLQPAQLTSFYPKTCGGTGERPFILSTRFMLGEGNTDGSLKHQPTTWTSQAQLKAAERLLLTKGMSVCDCYTKQCHHWACSAGWAWLPAPLLPPCGVTGPWRKSQAGGPYTAPFPGRDQETLLTETLGNTCNGTQKRGYVW